jgi:hypothetical protein
MKKQEKKEENIKDHVSQLFSPSEVKSPGCIHHRRVARGKTKVKGKFKLKE